MSSDLGYEKRTIAVHLLRGGYSVREVAERLHCSQSWIYKWWQRYREQQQWCDLEDQSRSPQHRPKKIATEVQQNIRAIRSELETEAQLPDKLSYIGAGAIQARYRHRYPGQSVPSQSTIERILTRSGMTHPKPQSLKAIVYPHIRPTKPNVLTQVDIVPHFLPGHGGVVACFEALDVVSRYPAGAQWLQKTSLEAMLFLLQVWQEIGISDYTQLDNESCFSGGMTHPGVIGRVLRLALIVGTQVIFSPMRHPESNGYVERFHQDYLKNVWGKAHLGQLEDVRQASTRFYQAYRLSEHHAELDGCSPRQVHDRYPARLLSADFTLPSKLAITEGQAHFIRKVSPEAQVSILNQWWDVPDVQSEHAVWATLFFRSTGTKLRIFDAAPDFLPRICLAEYDFPLKDPVVEFESPPLAVSDGFLCDRFTRCCEGSAPY